jgi:hypothetical protein
MPAAANGWFVEGAAPPQPPVDPTAVYSTPRAAPASSEQGIAARQQGLVQDAGAAAAAPAAAVAGGQGALGGPAGALAIPGAAAAAPGPLDSGVSLGPGITPLGPAPAAAPSDAGVFAVGGPPAAGELPAMYVPNPANALTSNDLLLKLSLGSSKEQLLPAANFLRGLVANTTSTPVDNVLFYDVTTKSGASGGQPTVDVTLLFKNT